MYDIILINPTVEEYKEFKTRFPIAKKAEDFRHAQRLAITEFFWVVWNDTNLINTFDFSYVPDQWSKDYIHVFKNSSFFDGIILVPKNARLTDNEIKHRFFTNKKEVDILASNPKSFDFFFVDNYNDYLLALENSKTEMFWMSSQNISYNKTLVKDYYISHHDIQLRKQTHAFVHLVNESKYYNGLFLCSKHLQLSKKEVEYRFPVNRIEHTEIGSSNTKYDIFVVDSYNDYLHALENSKTEMFWGTSNNIDTTDFNFDTYFLHDNEYDRKTNHAFVHRVDGKNLYNGIFLFSKHALVSKKEIEHRFIVNAKEWPIIASGPVKYEKFVIETYDDYLHALENSKTEMFWAYSNNLQFNLNFNFDTYFSHDNEYDRKTNHAFVHQVDDNNLYNGVFLLSKHAPVTKKEIEHRFIVNAKEWPVVASGPVKYEKFVIETYDDYLHALENSKTEMFWGTSSKIKALETFNFDTYFSHDNEYDRKINHAFVHDVLGKHTYDGIFLFSKHAPVSKKEIEHRFIVNAKEWPIIASTYVLYDVFEIDNFEDYKEAFKKSKTEMFWCTSRNIQIDQNFDFNVYYDYRDDEFITERKTNHAFVHQVDDNNLYNGVFLLSKYTPLSEKEIEYRHPVHRKEWPIIASGPVKYEKFVIETYDDYLHALENSKTEMFWGTSNNIEINKEFKFDIYFSHDNEYDRKINHAFAHQVDDKDLYNGLFLFSKHAPVSKKEIEHRHLVHRKEWPIIASGPVKYEKFVIETYDDYLHALENSKTEMFWGTSNNIDTTDFNFDIYFSHDNEYDRKINHAFAHRVDNQNLYNGVFLLTKYEKITEKEIEYRHLVHRKEWPIVASGPVKYEQFNINTYEEYLTALSTTKTEMFWVIPNYVIPSKRFKFDTYFSHNQTFERKINHVYLNGKYNDGIILCSKYSRFSKRELDYRFISDKKEVNIAISTPKPYDIVFISYQEPKADEFYKHLTDRFSNTKRIHGVKGIHQAHIEAAKICSTDMFWVVDGDALIDSKFNFDYQVARWDRDTVHVWRSINPINDLVYGYGGVKLLPTELVLNMDTSKPDMTTSISKKFKAVQEISNTTAFNTDPFNTWKSAFRECVKLSSNIIDRQKNEETATRLKVWCTVGEARPFGKYAINGATAGKIYGYKNQNNVEALAKINDFLWLKEQFDANTQ